MTAGWVARLDCGCEKRFAPPGLPPRVDSYITCPDGCLEGPKRVTAVDGPAVYVQDVLL